MKSLNFRKFYGKLKSGEKRITTRLNFIPQFISNETIRNWYNWTNLVGKVIKREFLFYSKILGTYPIQMKDLNDTIAILDGFSNKEEYIKGLLEINNKSKKYSLEHYCFIIHYEPLFNYTILNYIKETDFDLKIKSFMDIDNFIHAEIRKTINENDLMEFVYV